MGPDVLELIFDIAIVFIEPIANLSVHLPSFGHVIAQKCRVYSFGNIEPCNALLLFFVDFELGLVL